MLNFKITKNPFLLFLPFLIIYITLVLVFPTTGTFGDESRYLMYAEYMVSGFIPASEQGFDILGNGPGYSILIIPFVLLKLPLILITILNAFFYYFSIIILYKIINKFAGYKIAIIVGLFWALYYNLYELIIYMIPETFSIFLICLFAQQLIKSFSDHISIFNRNSFFAALILGFLILTKPIFGYVLIFMLLFVFIIYFFKANKNLYQKLAAILILALIFNFPYLIYTYQKTEKIFYWSSSGGNNLYWMSTPFENEYGDWHFYPKRHPVLPHDDILRESIEYKSLHNNHHKDFDLIKDLGIIQKDSALKSIAIQNIKLHPLKFLLNSSANMGRILFNYPYSYSFQKPATLLRLPMVGILLLGLLFTIIPSIRNRKKIPFSIKAMLAFAFIYFGGSIFGSAEFRMFCLIVPILLIWIAYVLSKSIKLKIDWND